jgi:predicted Zn-dependent protease
MRCTLALLTISCTAIIVTGCSTNPSTGRAQLDLISSDQVAAMGEQATPELIKEFGGEARSPELRRYVTQVGRRLAKQIEPEYKDVKWEFHTLESDVLNAFALPPGNVFVTTGLLSRLSNEAELAGVLGHEMGHITAAHVDERVSQQMLAELGLGVLGQTNESQIVNAGAQLLTQGTLLNFSRDQESEADEQGLKYMNKAGYDPRGMLGVLRVLVEADQGGGAPEFLSTHPDPRRRLNQAQKQIDEKYDGSKGELYESRFRKDAAPYLDSPRR